MLATTVAYQDEWLCTRVGGTASAIRGPDDAGDVTDEEGALPHAVGDGLGSELHEVTCLS